jgi:hypothetical protein
MASGAMFNEGVIKEFDNVFSHTPQLSTSSADEEHMITYRNTRTFQGKGNNTVIIPKYLNISNDATKGAILRVYSGTTLVGEEYNYLSENESTVVFDTAYTSFSNGTLRFSTGMERRTIMIIYYNEHS